MLRIAHEKHNPQMVQMNMCKKHNPQMTQMAADIQKSDEQTYASMHSTLNINALLFICVHLRHLRINEDGRRYSKIRRTDLCFDALRHEHKRLVFNLR